MADQTLASLTAATPATGGLIYGTQGGADRKFTLTAAGAAIMEAADSIKLDELAAPTDVTTLNATTSAHGLLPKLGGGTTNFLRADGNWAAPGGGSINLPLRAWVESTGDDGTGTVGDPGKPFLTMLAAYTAGARMMHLGAGTFAGITKTGTIDLTYIGHGRDKTTITTITSTTGGAISLRDVGFKSATVGSITLSYAGTGGTSAGALTLHHVLVSGNVTASGEQGLNGNSESLDGGPGGNGAILTGEEIEIGGSCYLNGASGGPPYNDGMTPASGGGGGGGGIVSVAGRLRVEGALNTSAGGGYLGLNGGSDGTYWNGGSVDADDLYVGTYLSMKSGGDFASPGDLSARKAFVNHADFSGSVSNNGHITGTLIVINTLENMSAPETYTLLLSHINGTAVGTS